MACGVKLWDCVIRRHKNSALLVAKDITCGKILPTISEINLNESLMKYQQCSASCISPLRHISGAFPPLRRISGPTILGSHKSGLGSFPASQVVFHLKGASRVRLFSCGLLSRRLLFSPGRCSSPTVAVSLQPLDQLFHQLWGRSTSVTRS